MSFSEKLQALRKANKMSQEKLADLLDVTRQSVSKWESGQTYREMDKLLAMCKIFKCSLDDLTNDEVTDIKVGEKKKNGINNLIDSMLELVNKTYHMFHAMRLKKVIKCLFVMFVIAIILLIGYVPFVFLSNRLTNLILTLGSNQFVYFVIGLIELLLNGSFFILYIILLVYLFKMMYLDRYDFQSVSTSTEKSSKDVEPLPEQKIMREIRPEKSYAFFEALGRVAIFFMKIMVFFILICPLAVSLFLFSAAFIVMLVLLFQGVLYFGILLGIIFAMILHVLILELLFNFLFNRKTPIKRTVILTIVSLIGLGISFGISMLEFVNTTYTDKAPITEKQKTIEKKIPMSDSLIIDFLDSYDMQVDNSLGNEIKIVTKYYPEYLSVDIASHNNGFIFIREENPENVFISKSVSLLIDGLKEKHLYNYSELFQYDVTIYASEENIQKLLDNYHASLEQEIQAEEQSEIESLRGQLDQVMEEKARLQEKNADKILNIMHTLYDNMEYEAAFKVIMHYIYFLRTLFVMQATSDIHHNEIAKHIADTFKSLSAVVYLMKKYGSQHIQNNAAQIILNYLNSFKESGGLSYQDSYMALLGVFVTDEYKPFNKAIKHIQQHTLSTRYLKCTYYYILSKTNPEKAAEFMEQNMRLDEVFLMAETYRYFNMCQEIELILRPRKKEAEKNSDAIDEYYNILCNAYEDLGNFTQMINILYEKLEDGYADAFAAIYNEIDHNNPKELERLITNAEKYLEDDKLIEEYMFFCLYDYTLPIIEKTKDEKLLLYFTELLIEKQDELNTDGYIDESDETCDNDIYEIMAESEIQEKEIFDKFFIKAAAVLQNKQIQSKKLQHKIAKLAK